MRRAISTWLGYCHSDAIPVPSPFSPADKDCSETPRAHRCVSSAARSVKSALHRPLVATVRHELIEFSLVLGSPQPTEERSELLLLFFKALQSIRAVLVERFVAAPRPGPPSGAMTRCANPFLPKVQGGASPPFQPPSQHKNAKDHETHRPTDPQAQNQNCDPYRFWVLPLIELQKRGHHIPCVNVNNIHIINRRARTCQAKVCGPSSPVISQP